MIRCNRYFLVLAGGLGLIIAPSSAMAACAQWDMNGDWRFAQSNLPIHRSPVFTLRQNGSDIQGNALFTVKYWSKGILHSSYGFAEIAGSVRGVINGDTLELTVFWADDDSIGVYTGKIDPQGRMEGTTYDKRDPDSTATWISERAAKCLIVESPPAPVPPAAPAAAALPTIEAQGRVRPDPANTPPATVQSICDMAAQASARNSPAAAGLAAKCVAQQSLHVDDLAAKGEAIAMQDPLAVELRQQQPDDAAQRGFDIGMAAAEGQTLPGPGKQRIHDSLATNEQAGFSAAVAFSLERNNFADLARRGAASVAARPAVAATRNRRADVFYRLGFDIATALFDGNAALDPASLEIRNKLSVAARNGFDAAGALQFGPNYKP